MNNLMPVIFFGHGNPMNALLQNEYTEGWAEIGSKIPTPRAIVSISAHWYISYCAVTAMNAPRTIHDFGGFPRELYEVQYPAPGDPTVAKRVIELLSPIQVTADSSWGLDHGTWSVLCHVFPKADVPILQLSIDETQPPEFHYHIGKALAPLRKEGILIIGSGNVVHNLHAYSWGSHPVEPYDWAVRFEEQLRKLLIVGNHEPLLAYEQLGRDAILSIPTPDHFLPLLYILGLHEPSERVSFPVTGFDGGSVSMLSIRIG